MISDFMGNQYGYKGVGESDIPVLANRIQDRVFSDDGGVSSKQGIFSDPGKVAKEQTLIDKPPAEASSPPTPIVTIAIAAGIILLVLGASK